MSINSDGCLLVKYQQDRGILQRFQRLGVMHNVSSSILFLNNLADILLKNKNPNKK